MNAVAISLFGDEEPYGPKTPPAITPRFGDPKRRIERDTGVGGNGHLAERTYHIDGGAPPLDWWVIDS